MSHIYLYIVSLFQGNTKYFIVVTTDYENYALNYACKKLNTDGTCAASQAWIQSREKTLADKYMWEIEEKLSSVCLSKKDFLLVNWDRGKFKPVHLFTCKYIFIYFSKM